MTFIKKSKNKYIYLYLFVILILLFLFVYKIYFYNCTNSEMNAYEKIINGIPVNALIIGDSIGEGSGASCSNNTWSMLLCEFIKNKYNCKLHVENISMGGNTSVAGFIRLIERDYKMADYDLVIICYGQNDEAKDFDIHYESLLREVMSRYPKCSMICVLEHSQMTYTKKINTIIDLAEYYHIPVVDTIKPFSEHKNGYDSLVIDGTHPNDDGYIIYANSILDVIESEIDRPTPVVLSDKPMFERSLLFENYVWYDSSMFERNGFTYTIEVGESESIIFIDYIFFPGYNNVTIYNNDRIIAENNFFWKWDFMQRHAYDFELMKLDDGILSIEFDCKEHADSFNGLGFTIIA